MSMLVPGKPDPSTTETYPILRESCRPARTRDAEADFWSETVAIVGLTILAIITSFLFLRV